MNTRRKRDATTQAAPNQEADRTNRKDHTTQSQDSSSDEYLLNSDVQQANRAESLRDPVPRRVTQASEPAFVPIADGACDEAKSDRWKVELSLVEDMLAHSREDEDSSELDLMLIESFVRATKEVADRR